MTEDQSKAGVLFKRDQSSHLSFQNSMEPTENRIIFTRFPLIYNGKSLETKQPITPTSFDWGKEAI